MNDTDPDYGWLNPRARPQTRRDLYQQIVISVALGLSAFSTFCILRPRWPQFYYARKSRIRNASILPNLPPTLFGWIPALWKISDREVLATAGLDAYVFLSFFKMSIKFLFVASLLAGAILAPIHVTFGHTTFLPPMDPDRAETAVEYTLQSFLIDKSHKKPLPNEGKSYLWALTVFVYVFTGLAFYFLLDQTQDVVQVRQEYLGNQTTVTDRTFKLSGIPKELRSEGILKEYIEKLGIGKVDSVTICRQWAELDQLVAARHETLQKLEEAHTVYRSKSKNQRNGETLPTMQPESSYPTTGLSPIEEAQPLLDGGSSHPVSSGRPQLTLRKKGFFSLKGKKVDAIHHLTMKLQRLDDQITESRRKEYTATPMAFITMESVPAAQVAVQALLDPVPGAMVASRAPAPSDIAWGNTYISRTRRSLRRWSINIFVTLLSVFWLIPVAALAVLWNITEIRRYAPGVADFLEGHPLVLSLVQSFLPTLLLSLLNVAVPYLYDWLSNYQGYISQAEVELSVITKNFFFTFFNLFLAFTISGTALTVHAMWDALKDVVMDARTIAKLFGGALEGLGWFYANLILLQGVGLFPFRMLQVGSVLLYPIEKYGAKTPRDFARLVEPPVFKYGFFLPQPIMIYIICIVYSVLAQGVLILAFGLCYFVLGYFTHKYQLLYSMEHPRHSTGKAWPIIVYRVILGLFVFQVAIAGYLILFEAYTPAALIVPLIGFTFWSIWHYNEEYLPSNSYIALKSIKDGANGPVRASGVERTLEEESEEGAEYVNPSLVTPLESVWIPQRLGEDGDQEASL